MLTTFFSHFDTSSKLTSKVFGYPVFAQSCSPSTKVESKGKVYFCWMFINTKRV